MQKITEVFDCFVFPNDVNEIRCFIDSEVVTLSCKKLSFASQVYNIKKDLKSLYGISSISSMSILDKNRIFIASSDYGYIEAPEISTNNKEVINAFKTFIFPLATSTLIEINDELYAAKIHNVKDNLKIRRKRALRDIIQEIVFRDTAKFK